MSHQPYDRAVLEPIRRDVELPLADVAEVADHAWEYSDDEAALVQHVVDDFQQTAHDTHADTTWPACPRHPNHPMWYRDGHWWCEKDGAAIVPLGELSRLRSS